ncbi:CocE/NonD family hydrolase, partial [bacterium]|nr:CocE/NonD family hydrolase [bacterium]
IPVYFTDDRYTDDCHYRGGAWRCYYDIGAYGASMIGMNAMPPYPEYSGDDWAEIWEQHLEENTPYIAEWLTHPTDGPYWRPGSIRGRYEQIKCPVFMIGGWRDGYPNPPLRTFAALEVPKRLLMGPWKHARPNVAIPGPRIDWLREVVRWCDHWLKDEDNGVMDEPAVQIYMQTYDEPLPTRTETSGYWRAEADLEPEGSEKRVYELRAEGLLALEATPRDEEGYDEYEYRPTVGICGGLWSGGVPFGLPTDQRPDEVHSLTYSTEPLAQDLEICGWPQVELYASSTAPVMVFVVRLCDVAPDGTSALVCSGVLNGTRRASLDDPQALESGTVYALNIDLDASLALPQGAPHPPGGRQRGFSQSVAYALSGQQPDLPAADGVVAVVVAGMAPAGGYRRDRLRPRGSGRSLRARSAGARVAIDRRCDGPAQRAQNADARYGPDRCGRGRERAAPRDMGERGGSSRCVGSGEAS